MHIPIARYGVREVVIALALGGSATVLCIYTVPWLSPIPLLILLFVAFFFRDPRRNIPEGEEKILSPADGKVVEVAEVYEPNFIKGPAVKVSVFLSVFNCHINRSPVSGYVEFLRYQCGRFKSAFRKDAPRVNENNMIGISCFKPQLDRILVKQIAGVLARRIVCDCDVNDLVLRGEKIGMIKLGSRTDIYIPASAPFKLLVKKGDKVVAGETILGVCE